MSAHGYVDQFAYSACNGGWLLAGWIPLAPRLAQGLPAQALTADLVTEVPANGAVIQLAFFERSDLKDSGVGVVGLLRYPPTKQRSLRQVTLRFGDSPFRMNWVNATTQLPEQEMIRHCRKLVTNGFGPHREELANSLRADAFAGQSTFESLPEFVRLGVDEMIVCRPGEAVLIGWLLTWPGTITQIAVCTPVGVYPLDLNAVTRTERLDVLDSVGRDWGFDDSRCGFIAFTAGIQGADGPCWLRIETADGGVAYATVPVRRLRGMRAIQRILDVVDLHEDDVRVAFDQVIGPSCRALNAERLASLPSVSVARFGNPLPQPRVSVVVPLYGRVDYLEHQLATFMLSSPGNSWELLYVLDDPRKRREALSLADSAYERFQLPFQLLTVSENRGFAPACNAGLRAARGDFVCFLNSDMLPATPAFLDRLADQLETSPLLGIVGASLLFEDGSVQHEQMVMQPLLSKGGLRFPIHPRKGWRPRTNVALERCEMVTGACMMMRRSVCEEFGGFDEGFIIGDFEDADLCARLRESGRDIAVDHAVRLFHFERQSQVAPDQRWRSNLTVFNAWLFDQRHPVAAAG